MTKDAVQHEWLCQ